VLPEPLASAAADPDELASAVGPSRRYALLTIADTTLSMHRLVQTVLRDQLDQKQQQDWAAVALQLLNTVFPEDSEEVAAWPEWQRFLAHALSVVDHAERLAIQAEATSQLLVRIARYQNERAQYGTARANYERALAIDEVALGPNHPQVATVANNLGEVLWAVGDLNGARVQLERALAINEAIRGPNDPSVGVGLFNLAQVLKDLGDLPGARRPLSEPL
jgi:tetratricopeptide (TPR) repeat protein